ncbi:MAG: heme exporter protein CcmB [Candidatus Heimdallarchaeota archaeon]
MLSDILFLAKKDLTLEFRKKETLFAMGLFSLASVLIFSTLFNLADISQETRETITAASLWFIITFSVMLGVTSIFLREVRKSTVDALLSLAIKPQAIFLAKLVYLCAILAIIEVITIALAIVFMRIGFSNQAMLFGAVLVIGSFDLAIGGCIVSFLTIYAKSKTLAVPILFFPIVLPSILIATQATSSLVLYDDPGFVMNNILILFFHAILLLTLALAITDDLINQ